MIEFRKLAGLKVNEYDRVFAIVRSMRFNIKGVERVKELAPSPDLFRKQQAWSREGIWTQDKFDKEFVEEFLEDLSHSKDSIDMLNFLYYLDKQGDNICCICYCGTESMCHRSIIAGILQGTGANVKVEDDYSKYYYRFKELLDS
jgi:uncharacterized protein YeaO (DUF488 family)